MSTYDVVVAGSGPAGSIAALTLASGGARVLLVDPSPFPRDKACGDVICPRGVRLLDDLGIDVPGSERVDDMLVVAPSGRTARLPWPAGRDYPPYCLTAPRELFDARLHDAALAAGAEPCSARVLEVTDDGVALSTGETVRAEHVIGADGSMSRVAASAGLARPQDSFLALALRYYVDQVVENPMIVFWQPDDESSLPGYGWLFPGPGGRANVGLGVAVGYDRQAARVAKRMLPEFAKWLHEKGLTRTSSVDEDSMRGGWLKLGMAGSVPARDRVLLCGDATGLVNPLQGEGISQAMLSAYDAAGAILAQPATAAVTYRRRLAERFGRFYPVAAGLHAIWLAHPRAVAIVGRALAAPGIGRRVSAGWGIWWYDLLEGAPRGRARGVASFLTGATRLATARSPVRRRVLTALTSTDSLASEREPVEAVPEPVG